MQHTQQCRLCLCLLTVCQVLPRERRKKKNSRPNSAKLPEIERAGKLREYLPPACRQQRARKDLAKSRPVFHERPAGLPALPPSYAFLQPIRAAESMPLVPASGLLVLRPRCRKCALKSPAKFQPVFFTSTQFVFQPRRLICRQVAYARRPHCRQHAVKRPAESRPLFFTNAPPLLQPCRLFTGHLRRRGQAFLFSQAHGLCCHPALGTNFCGNNGCGPPQTHAGILPSCLCLSRETPPLRGALAACK